MAIGGYFELELPVNREYHETAIRLNTGRNALEYILKANAIQKLYIPYFTCDVLLEPLEKLHIPYSFYPIDKNMLPLFSEEIKENEALLYTNYFGVFTTQVKEILQKYPRVIVDNAQAFFAPPIPNTDCFYSARKFFGVPDGAYVYCTHQLNEEIAQDESYNRYTYLVGRMEKGAENYFAEYKKINSSLSKQAIKQMSFSTQRLLQSIDYQNIISKRKSNFSLLHKSLGDTNMFPLHAMSTDDVPMVYPYTIPQGSELKKYLIANNIYVATYWPNVLTWCTEDSWEYFLANHTVFIPIDQRYGTEDMEKILQLIEST